MTTQKSVLNRYAKTFNLNGQEEQQKLTDNKELKARQESFKQMPDSIVIYTDSREVKR